jgi:hypothetical protein
MKWSFKMNLKKIFKPCFAALILSNSLFAYAATSNIPCPSVEDVRNSWQSVDTVQQDDERNYSIYSSDTPIFDEASKLWWQIAAQNNGPDFNGAFAQGVKDIKNLRSADKKYADEIASGLYACFYLDNTGTPVGFAIAESMQKTNAFKTLKALHK